MIETLTTDRAASILAHEGHGFTYQGARVLVEYLEAIEEGSGEPLEFDPVAIRCDFSEYDSAIEAASEYGWEPDDDDDDARAAAALDWLRDRTTVLDVDGDRVIVAVF